jgi:GNAT superfamily N-acetyltransferase
MLVRAARLQDAASIARVHVDSWRSTYPGIVPDKVLTHLSYSDRETRWHNILVEHTQSVYVAEDDQGQVVGFAAGGPCRVDVAGYDGELYAIYLYDTAQGRGLGRQLMRQVAHQLAASGCTALLVWVLADNPARGFYEALGGVYITEKQVDIGGDQPLREVAYGWPDIQTLLERKNGDERGT